MIEVIQQMLFLIASAVAFLAAVLYWMAERRNRELEKKLGDKIIEEYERRNLKSVEDHASGRSDSDLFKEAVQRGISKMPPVPRSKGPK